MKNIFCFFFVVRRKKKKTKWKNSNVYEYWQQQAHFRSNGQNGKTAHFSFKWAKPTLLHSFYTVLPNFYFTMLPIAQFSAAKVYSNVYEYWQQQAHFRSNGQNGKTAHFSFKWAKPTLLHSFYTVLPNFYFTMLPIAQFSAAKVWLWIIEKKKKK